MKNTIILISFLFLAQLAITQEHITPQKKSTITVNIEGFKSNEGLLYIGLYNSESTWLSNRYQSTKESIIELKSTTSLVEVPNGTYAISIYHDANENGKLDTGWFGIPTEDYGCSRGALGRFGPPKWEDAVFTVNGENQTIFIKF